MPIKKFHSISGRLLRRIVAVMLITMTITSGVVFLLTMSGVSAVTNEHFNDILNLTDERVTSIVKTVEVSAVNNVDELSKHLARPESASAALANELRLNPHIVGCGLAFVPDYYRSKGRWFELYAHPREDGTVEVRQIGSREHDYLQTEWYREGLTAEKGYWSNPYYDDSGAQDLLCTYVLPVHDDKGRVAAVFGADVSLTWAMDQLKGNDRQMNENVLKESETDRDESVYSFILGRKGEFLVHPDSTRILKDFFSYAPEGHFKPVYEEIGKAMISGERGDRMTLLDGYHANIFYAPLLRTGWSVGVVVPFKLVVTPGIGMGLLILFLLAAGLLVAFLLTHGIIRRTTRPLKFLAHSAEEVAKGHFDTPLPEMHYNDEIHRLRDSFDNMQHSLTAYVEELKNATAQQASIDRELGIARDIQMSMLPKTFPPFPERDDIDIYGQLTPAKAVGGDLYDFLLREERLFFCIGDVSGKGVPAAMVMAAIASHFQSMASREDSPASLMKSLNAVMSARNESMMFATLFVGILDLSTGELAYCNAGHDAPVLIRADGGAKYLDVASNLALGIDGGFPYVQQSTTLAPGSTVFLYTDGLSEAEDPAHALFGLDRILDTAGKAADPSPRPLVTEMADAVRRFASGAEQSDDLTMMALRYKAARR